MEEQLLARMRVFCRTLAIFLVLGTVFAVSYYHYRCSQILPQDMAPSHIQYPEVTLDLLRTSLTPHAKFPQQAQLYPIGTSYAARLLLDRNSPERAASVEKNWKESFKLAALWVYLNWTESQILNTILDQTFFAGEWRGISIASREFFGAEVSDLKAEEVAVLIANIKSNSKYDPWCNQEEVYAEASRLLKEYAQTKQVAFVPVESGAMFARLKQRTASCTN